MQKQDPWLSRLSKEFAVVKDYCEFSDYVEYSASPLREGLPPDRYLMKYNLRSIIGIDDCQNPIFGFEHFVSINLPHDYPMVSGPACKMITDIWHPNIRHDGAFKGRICINSKALGSWFTLDMLIHQIGEMLQYKNYHADNVQPYPEDPIVAKWVKSFAEPQGIFNKDLNHALDTKDLQNPSQEWLETRKKKIVITQMNKRHAKT